MNDLVDKIIKLIATESLSHKDKMLLTNLVRELLGERKNWLNCLKQKLVLPSEVAAGILSHISTTKNGRFSSSSVIDFNKESELANLLSSST